MKLWYLEYLRYLNEVKKLSLDKVKLLVKKSEVEGLTHLDDFEDYIQYFLKNTPIKSRLILMNRVPSLCVKGL